MSAEQVALIPQCAECREIWLPADEERVERRPLLQKLPASVRTRCAIRGWMTMFPSLTFGV
jgi:hypothetical protein